MHFVQSKGCNDQNIDMRRRNHHSKRPRLVGTSISNGYSMKPTKTTMVVLVSKKSMNESCLFYIELNRKAPIPPPSKQRVKLLYDSADWSHNKRLDSDEFQALASTLAARGYTRLLAHKIVTIVVAPLVANYAVQSMFVFTTIC